MVAKCLVIIVCAVIDAVKGDTTAELYGKTRVHVKTLTSHIHVQLWSLLMPTGDSVMGQLEIYSSGPFGSKYTGEWFSDWWQSLNGHAVKPQHWPDQINIRAGGRIDA